MYVKRAVWSNSVACVFSWLCLNVCVQKFYKALMNKGNMFQYLGVKQQF